VVAVVLQWLLWFAVPIVAPEALLYGMLGALICAAVIVVWWVLFSRAAWPDRIGAIVLMVVAVMATKRIVHQSIAGGMMGMMLPVFSIPALSLALVAAATVGRRLTNATRRALILAAIVLGCGVFLLLRTGGITGEANSDWHWRWSKTPEERLLAQAADEPSAPTTPVVTKAGIDWPGFRGSERDGVVHGVRIKTDWVASPPVELWRRSIGPGWSSFAVSGDLVYTQEQRGDEEIVSCYSLSTGKPVWRHSDSARFWESNAGPGPRGTPTISNGRLYTLGATGIVNVLDAGTGAVIWSRNAASDTGAKLPGWGFASSPLVVNDLVVVATAGKLVAYDLGSGKPRWFGPDGGAGYSSPQLVTLKGVQQILLLCGPGAISVSPTDGQRLWEYPLSSNTRIIQPALTADGDVLVNDGEGNGMRRLAVEKGPNGWTVTERWTSEGLNPYFNDFVVREGYAYGFDGSNLACIDLKDGNRKWKGGTFGHGQLVLLSDQALLLVLTEEGELALVKAAPEQFAEVARFPAIKGKTWNHPALVGDTLLVRNGEEMAAFRLKLAD
jgi:outer membrane protein assembly factor BamB